MTQKSMKSPMSWLTVAMAAAVVLGLGSAVSPATAQERHDNRPDMHQDNRPDNRRNDHRAYDQRDNRWRDGNERGYYREPPVVYGSPCGYNNCAPPLVYSPGISVLLPSIIIR